MIDSDRISDTSIACNFMRDCKFPLITSNEIYVHVAIVCLAVVVLIVATWL